MGVAFVASGKGHSASFESVLSSLRREQVAEVKLASAPRTFATASFFADTKPAYGFAAAADLAFEDFEPAAAPPPKPAAPAPRPAKPKPLPSDAPDAIASELELPRMSDPASLRSLRRSFMWANHPDRRPDLPRDLANRRVAIANMLIDRALKANRPTGR